jgi:threonine/homoserine/homoserine lactone efflux protein
LFEEIGVFYRGLVLGIMITVPMGPIALLCIRRTLQRGFIIGFSTGIGAATCDTLFSAMAVLGVVAILDLMHHYDMYIRMIGGLALLFGAWHAWRDRPEPPTRELTDLVGKMLHVKKDYYVINVIKSFVSGFGLTLTNPVTLFAVLAIVATFSHVENHLEAITLIMGIATGSALWWLTLSGGVTLIRELFSNKVIILVNRFTAVVLVAGAVWAIASGVRILCNHHGIG